MFTIRKFHTTTARLDSSCGTPSVAYNTPGTESSPGDYIFEISIEVAGAAEENETEADTYTKQVTVPEVGSESLSIELSGSNKMSEDGMPASGEI